MLKFRYVAAFVCAILGTSANAACTIGSSTADVTSPLSDSDKSWLRTAAINGWDITTCDVSQITDFSSVFSSLTNFNQDISNWDVSSAVNMEMMFYQAAAFNQDISGWSTSNVTNMGSMFNSASSFNQNIDAWDVSNVTDMSAMFHYASAFNSPLDTWDVGNVTNMRVMFYEAQNFNKPLASWNVGNVTNMSSMFYGTSFDQPLAYWDVSNVTDMGMMFQRSNFDQDISNWDVSSVTNIGQMFSNTPFNQDISAWDVSNVTAMYGVFQNNVHFNQDIGSWDVSSATRMFNMFNGASSFNQNIGAWDVSNVEVMFYMFKGATAFNQDIGSWDVSNVDSGTGFLSGMFGMFRDATSFNQSLISWNVQRISREPDEFSLGATNWASSNKPLWGQSPVSGDNTAPSVQIGGPTSYVTSAFDIQIVFSEPVTGFDVTDLVTTNAVLSNFAFSSDRGSVTVTPNIGERITIKILQNSAIDAAGNGNDASNIYEVVSASPASEFDKHRDVIRGVILTDVENKLRSTLDTNVKLVRGATSRFIEVSKSSEQVLGGLPEHTGSPMQVSGSAKASSKRQDINGTFAASRSNDFGKFQRFVNGDFHVTREDANVTTVSVRGTINWETMVNNSGIVGYFLGAKANRSIVDNEFSGSLDGYGIHAGAYFVNSLSKNAFLNGYASIGHSATDVSISNDVLKLVGDFATNSATVGAAVTGYYEYGSVNFRPEFALDMGYSDNGVATFTGHAFGLTDRNLQLDPGNVEIAVMRFQPELQIKLEQGIQRAANSMVSVAPRIICERLAKQVRRENCGQGVEIGFVRSDIDTGVHFQLAFKRDMIGSASRDGFELRLTKNF